MAEKFVGQHQPFLRPAPTASKFTIFQTSVDASLVCCFELSICSCREASAGGYFLMFMPFTLIQLHVNVSVG
jgi:hypothetical protein